MKLSLSLIDDAVVVKIVGEIDITTVAKIEEYFLTLDVSSLVIDLSEVSFMDTSGVHFLVDVSSRMLENEGAMTLVVIPESPVHLLLKLTGLSDQFTIVESTDSAVGS